MNNDIQDLCKYLLETQNKLLDLSESFEVIIKIPLLELNRDCMRAIISILNATKNHNDIMSRVL